MNVLFVDADQVRADRIQRDLATLPDNEIRYEHVSCLTDSLDQMASQPFDVVLMNWELPDSEGLDTLVDFAAAQPAIPIVMLTVPENEEMAIEALRHGAQDYILSSELDGISLLRSLRNAVERNRHELTERRVWETQMQERERVSRELHDSMHQSLNSIRVQLQVLSDKLLASERDQRSATILADRPNHLVIAAGKANDSPHEAAEPPSSPTTASTAATELELTARQSEILRLIAAGDTSKRIAKKLNIHIKTVDNHRRILRDKLGVQSTAAMIRVAQEHGRI